MEKLSLSLDEIISKLEMVSELALDNWTQSVDGAVDSELLGFLEQRVRTALRRINGGCAIDLSESEPSLADEGVAPRILLFDRDEYLLMKEELSKAFRKQIGFLNLDAYDKEVAESQISFILQMLEDSIAVNLMSALFNLQQRLESERRYIKDTVSNITKIFEGDRRRLAFDLHDGPAQTLSSALLQVDMLEEMVASSEAKEELASLRSILRQCLHELRTSIYTLRPQSMSQRGLVAKIEGYTRQFSSRTGIEVDTIIEPQEKELPGTIEINVFRIVQEALSNVSKHAQASRVSIRVVFGISRLSCTIEDNGSGFNYGGDNNTTKELDGYGLISMRDRIRQFLGTFYIDSKPGKGTRISFNIPL